MAEVISSRSEQIVIKGFNPNFIIERQVNGSDIFPGKVVTNYGEANAYDVDLCGAGEPALGIALEHHLDDGLAGIIRDTPDIDTAYTDNASVRIALCGSGMVCMAFLAGQTTTTAIYGGSKLCAAASGNLTLPTFTSTTAQLSSDFLGYVGKSIEYDAGGSLVKTLAVII